MTTNRIALGASFLAMIIGTACGSSAESPLAAGGTTTTAGAGGGDSMTCPAAVELPTPTCDGYAIGLVCSGGDEPTFTCTCAKDGTGAKLWSCKSDTGAGGSGGGPLLDGVTAAFSTLPVSNQPAPNLDPKADVLELSPTFECADVGTEIFDCNHQGYAFAFAPGTLKIGDFDLASLPGYEFAWVGACAAGGGGIEKLASGTLSVTALDAASVEGTVKDLVVKKSGPSMAEPPFSFHVARCP